jgi:hypothetical protein
MAFTLVDTGALLAWSLTNQIRLVRLGTGRTSPASSDVAAVRSLAATRSFSRCGQCTGLPAGSSGSKKRSICQIGRVELSAQRFSPGKRNRIARRFTSASVWNVYNQKRFDQYERVNERTYIIIIIIVLRHQKQGAQQPRYLARSRAVGGACCISRL